MVLAGGASRRLGGVPKGLERIGGSRIIDRVVSSLHESGVVGDIVLAANDDLAHEWLDNVTVVRDSIGVGGLAGVAATLNLGRDAVVLAWDMPFVPPAFVAHLVRTARRGAPLVLPEGNTARAVEPFCAWYSATLRPRLEDFLRAGPAAAHRFVDTVADRIVIPLEDCARHGDPRVMFMSVNTPEDLARARAIAESER